MRVRGVGRGQERGQSLVGRRAGTLALIVLLAAAGSANTERHVQGDPKSLVIAPEEFAVEFAVVGGDYQPGGGYVAMYFRPEILAAQELPDGDLLGVMAGLQILGDGAEARKSFETDSSVESIRASVRRSSPASPPIEVRPLEARPEAAYDSFAFRLEYELQGVRLVEYRYRLLIGNAVANLVVSGRVGAGGREPSSLADQARHAAEAQAARLVAVLE